MKKVIFWTELDYNTHYQALDMQDGSIENLFSFAEILEDSEDVTHEFTTTPIGSSPDGLVCIRVEFLQNFATGQYVDRQSIVVFDMETKSFREELLFPDEFGFGVDYVSNLGSREKAGWFAGVLDEETYQYDGYFTRIDFTSLSTDTVKSSIFPYSGGDSGSYWGARSENMAGDDQGELALIDEGFDSFESLVDHYPVHIKDGREFRCRALHINEDDRCWWLLAEHNDYGYPVETIEFKVLKKPFDGNPEVLYSWSGLQEDRYTWFHHRSGYFPFVVQSPDKKLVVLDFESETLKEYSVEGMPDFHPQWPEGGYTAPWGIFVDRKGEAGCMLVRDADENWQESGKAYLIDLESGVVTSQVDLTPDSSGADDLDALFIHESMEDGPDPGFWTQLSYTQEAI